MRGRALPLTTECELREELRKIAALFEGAATAGECDAAAAGLGRIGAAMDAAAQLERPVEMNFRLPDRWGRRLFLALCRRYGLPPYRYPLRDIRRSLCEHPNRLSTRPCGPSTRDFASARRIFKRGNRADH